MGLVMAVFLVSAVYYIGANIIERQRTIAENAAAAAEYTPGAVIPTESAQPAEPVSVGDFAAAAVVLRDTDAPFNLTVVGDSTGYPQQGWLMASLTDLREVTGRTISYHLWNTDTNAYEPAQIIGNGEPTLIVWNGSAPGKTPEYSTEHLAAMMPETPDMLIINHGHNTDSANKIHRLVEDAARLAGEGAAIGVMLQNPEAGAGEKDQTFIMNHLAEKVRDWPGVVLIDAYSPLAESQADVLMEDGVHPTEQGYRIWADTFLNSLGL